MSVVHTHNIWCPRTATATIPVVPPLTLKGRLILAMGLLGLRRIGCFGFGPAAVFAAGFAAGFVAVDDGAAGAVGAVLSSMNTLIPL